MTVLLDEVLYEQCPRCLTQGYYEEADTTLVIRCIPCARCDGVGLIEHQCE